MIENKTGGEKEEHVLNEPDAYNHFILLNM